jgi:hypothetical protein
MEFNIFNFLSNMYVAKCSVLMRIRAHDEHSHVKTFLQQIQLVRDYETRKVEREEV